MDDRLTNRNDDGGIAARDLPAALKKLAEYEDAEEQGTLVTLPVKIGQKVYIIVKYRYVERIEGSKVVSVELKKRYPLDLLYWQIYTDDNHMFEGNDIGKTVFLSREEAEAALQEREART